MEFAQFPKNLAYNIKTLCGFSKATIVLTPDKYATVLHGDTIKVKLPSNIIVDLRTRELIIMSQEKRLTKYLLLLMEQLPLGLIVMTKKKEIYTINLYISKVMLLVLFQVL